MYVKQLYSKQMLTKVVIVKTDWLVNVAISIVHAIMNVFPQKNQWAIL
jgi:hypothetical protein